MYSNGLKCEQKKEECKIVSKRFYCYECNFLFSQKSLLDTHMENHLQFRCPNCEYTTYVEDDFKCHKQSHECGELLNCSKCNFSTNSKQSLSNHERKHTKPFACKECGKTFSHELYMKAHFAHVHMKRKSFSCNEDNCSFTSDHKSALVNHERKHTRPFLCKECGKGFTHEKIRDTHFSNDHQNVTDKQNETEPEPLSCTVCDFKCRSKTDFQDHINDHHFSPSFFCKICGYEVHSESMLNSHMIIHKNNSRTDSSVALETIFVEHTINDSNNNEKDHYISTERKFYTCTNCGHNFKSHLHLKWHLLTHGDEKFFSCSKCKYKTKSANHFKSHSKKHIGKHIAFQECNYKTEGEILFVKPLLLHKNEKKNHKNVTVKQKEIELEPLSCTVCDFKSGSKAVFQEHINGHHALPLFICQICSYEVISESMLKSHMVTHENDNTHDSSVALEIRIEERNINDSNIDKKDDTKSAEKKIYACTKCGHNFDYLLHLKWHLLIHGDEKYFSCSECEYKTKKTYNFKLHSKQHIGKLIACQECNYKTKDIILLVEHMKNHERDVHMKRNFFSCNENNCSFTTNHKSSLINHVRKHTRPFICKECGKGFTHEKMRNTHFSNDHQNVTDKQKETEPEPFSCTVCEFKCRSITDFQDHINNCHLKPSFICQICSYEVNSESMLKSHMVTHENNNTSESSVALKKLFVENNIKDSNINKKNDIVATEKKIYTCSNCGHNFKSHLHLKWHFLTHGDEKYFSCSECEYKTKKVYNFKSHSKTHIGKLIACQECDYITEDEILLVKHMKFHKKEKKKLGKRKHENCKQNCVLSFICSYCSAECASLRKLTKHIQNHNNGDLKNYPNDGLQTCPAKNSDTFNASQQGNNTKLSKELTPRNNLEIANGTENVIKSFSCGINGCEEIFSSLGILKKHIHIHKEEKIYNCNDCDYKGYTTYELEKHEYTHREHTFIDCDIMGNDMKEFDMYKKSHNTKCDANMPVIKNTIDSMKDNCTVGKKQCPKCKISFSSKFELTRHLKSHKQHKMFTCNLCTYKDKRLYNVVIHKEKVHCQLSRLKCDKCSFKTCVLKRLEKHKLSHKSQNELESQSVKSEVKESKHLICYGNIASEHQITTESLYIKSKIISSVYNKHRKKHKMFKCNLCAYEGKRSYHVVIHKEKVHGLLSRLKCDMCSFKTCVLKRFEAHKLSHNRQNKLESEALKSEVEENKHLLSYGNIDSVHQIPTESFDIKSEIKSEITSSA